MAAHYRHTAFAFLTCFIFATHLPERLAPGHFDYIGKQQEAEFCSLAGQNKHLPTQLQEAMPLAAVFDQRLSFLESFWLPPQGTATRCSTSAASWARTSSWKPS